VKRIKVSTILFCLLFSMGIMLVLSGCSSYDPTFAISGNITSGGSALPAVTVTLAGGTSQTVTTDAMGNYFFGDIPSGTYTVTASLAGYTFSPPVRTAYLNGIDATGFDFSASIRGRVATKNHTVYLKSDGTVLAWGNNANGQLGDGSTTQKNSPVPVGGLTGVVTAVAAGNDHTVALTSDGTVWAWGSNIFGQLGDGTTTDSATPVTVGGLSGVTTIAAGFDHTVALKNDGTVWAWGNNSKGQLGQYATATPFSKSPVQVGAVTGFPSVTAIAAGQAYTVVLRIDGTVWAWGSNSSGQLGNNTTTDSATPVQVSGLGGMIAIAAGNGHTVALRNDLTVLTVLVWGNNANGQLGNGTTTNSAVPVKIGGLPNVTAIAAGYDHTAVLASDGTVWTWGNNNHGQLGDGTTTNSATPVTVSGLSGVTAIAAGNEDTVVVKSDSTVWAWGNNTNGQLGYGTTADRLTPVKVQ
jgi:alpha-tubulin suppressor-like RCC1 family protein